MTQYVVKPENRGKDQLAGDMSTIEGLESEICSILKRSLLGALPLKRVNQRFASKAALLGTKLNPLLSDMRDRGLIGIKQFVRLNRTFIFDGKVWDECMEDYKAGIPVFENLEKAFKDEK